MVGMNTYRVMKSEHTAQIPAMFLFHSLSFVVLSIFSLAEDLANGIIAPASV